MIIKILSVLSLLGLLWGGITTSLYLTSQKDLKASIIESERLSEALKSCEEDKLKQEQSSSTTEIISTENIIKIQELEKDKQSLIDKLNNIPSKAKCNPSNEVVQDGEADIDDKLPSELISLLSESNH